MSLLYSINKNITKNFGIFKDILFLIPCLLVDGWEEITKDIKRAPSSTTTMLIIICSILIVYYVIPLLRKWNKISQTKFELLQKLESYKVRPADKEPPGKYETGTQSHEGQAGTLGVIEYLEWIGE